MLHIGSNILGQTMAMIFHFLAMTKAEAELSENALG